MLPYTRSRRTQPGPDAPLLISPVGSGEGAAGSRRHPCWSRDLGCTGWKSVFLLRHCFNFTHTAELVNVGFSFRAGVEAHVPLMPRCFGGGHGSSPPSVTPQALGPFSPIIPVPVPGCALRVRVTQGPSCHPAAMAQPLRAGPAHHLAALPCSLGATTCHFLCPQEGHPPGPHTGAIFFEGEGEGSFLLPKSPSCLPVSPQMLPVGPGSCPSVQGLPEVGKPELKRACSLPCHLSPGTVSQEWPSHLPGVGAFTGEENRKGMTRRHASIHKCTF